MTKSISVIIPLYNEKESLPELCEKIASVMDRMQVSEYEIILINDGSSDGSGQVIRDLAGKNPRIKGISFQKNYGKAAALSAGFAAAKNDCIVTMDADLQDDPAEIPEMTALLDQGYDLVSGWKKKRRDPFFTKNIPSKFFNLATSMVSGIRLHDFNCGLKAYRKNAAKSLTFYGEMHRFLPVLAHWNGFKVTEKPVQHQPRKYGKTKYGFSRFLNGFLDLLTITFLRRYTKNPLHLFGLMGIFFMLVGFAIIGYFGVIWIIERALHIRPLMLLGIGSFLMGIQLFSIGFIGEMITHTGRREEFLVAEKINLD
jgi:glycosyltransferase involved in cell wall biosynthesis